MKSCKPEKERLEPVVSKTKTSKMKTSEMKTPARLRYTSKMKLHGKISARLADIPAYYDAAIPVTRLRFFHIIALTGTARLAWPAISNHITPEPF